MSKVDEIKKVAAMVTTAEGDLSAVEGVSISEVIEFMADNLNVAADGTLIVSELKVSNVGGNLLSEPVIFETASHEAMIETEPFSLVEGKNYKVSGTYGTPANTFEYTAAASLMGDDGKVRTIALITPTEALLNGHLAIMIMCHEELVEGGLVEGATPYMIMIGGMGEGDGNGSGYSDGFFENDTYSPVVINSITEA